MRSFLRIQSLHKPNKSSVSLDLLLGVSLYTSSWKKLVDNLNDFEIYLPRRERLCFWSLDGISSSSEYLMLEAKRLTYESLFWTQKILFSFWRGLTLFHFWSIQLTRLRPWGNSSLGRCQQRFLLKCCAWQLSSQLSTCVQRLLFWNVSDRSRNDMSYRKLGRSMLPSPAPISMGSKTLFSTIAPTWEYLLFSDSINAGSIIVFTFDNRTQRTPSLFDTLGRWVLL